MAVNCARYFRQVSLAAVTALLSFAVSPTASSSPFVPTVFTGGGYGPTADVAIQSALWDAEATASYFQLYNCRMVGDILIFSRSNPRFGRTFNAEVTVECSS